MWHHRNMATADTLTDQPPPPSEDIRAFLQSSLSDERLQQEFTRTMSTDEFSIYVDKIEDIRQKFETHVVTLRSDLKQSADTVLEHCSITDDRIARYEHGKKRRWAIQAATVAIMGVGVFLLDYYFKLATGVWVVIGIVAFFTIGGMPAYNSERKSEVATWMRELQQEQDLFRQELDTKLTEILRTSITEEFRKAGKVHFPVSAPTLVELTTAKIVPSTTRQTVIEFIRNHQSSAIGIAGPRGSGKSTLMQAIFDSTFPSHSVLIPAPVKYDPIDFTRRLFLGVATEIASKAHYSTDRRGLAQDQRILLLRSARAALTAGIALSATSVVFASIVKSVWHGRWATNVAAATSLVGLVIALLGGILLIVIYLEPFWNRVATSGPGHPSVHQAVEAIDILTWDTKEATAETSTVKLLGGLLTLGGQDSMTRSRRELSLPDLVDKFRKLLATFSAEKEDGRFVVFIDELDKIADTDELINVINGLKDLLHIPGVHFVVSVSMEALRRFEERGVPARDAFDSAFDVIVPARLLTLDESCQVLAARVAAFPTILALYCHAWSGGLPRDLLRIARNCVDVQRSTKDVLDVSEVIRRVIATDLGTHLENALYGSNSYEYNKAIMRLRELIRDLESGCNPLQILQAITSEDATKPILISIVTVGITLLACMPTGASDPDWWEKPTQPMRTKIEAVAAARVALSGPVALQRETIAAAVQLVSPGLLPAS